MNTDQSAPVFITLALFFVIAIFIRMLWRIMKDNNIFMDDADVPHYAVSEEKQEHISKNMEHFLELATTVNIVGFIIFICNQVWSTKTLFNAETGNPNDYSWCFFCFNILALAALYLYVWLNEPVFAFFHNYKYVAKIWSTFLLMCPIVLIPINYHHITKFDNILSFYFLHIVLLSGLGCLTYCVLMYAVNHYSKNAWKGRKRKNHIIRLVQPALFSNFAIFGMLLHVGWAWVYNWLPCAIIMGFAMRFYSIDKTIYTDETAIEEKTVEIIGDEKGTNKLA